jgi:rubredoxin-NAD+ reductase
MKLVIVGSGLAGYTVAREWRKLDRDSSLTIVTADGGGFYSKPMLSNALARKQEPDALVTSDADKMAAELDAEILARRRVRAIGRDARELRSDDGALAYDQLVLAVGASPIQIPIEGDAAADVLRVNNLDQYRVFRERIKGKQHVALLGPGLIGSEFANDLAGAGYRVSVIGPDAHPLGRLVPAPVGQAVQQALAGLGVEWHLGTVAQRIDRDGDGVRLELENGDSVSADVVLSAIGLRPELELARDAGLEVNRGIAVDRSLRSSDANIFALGDCAEVAGRVMPFVMPIMHCARALARTLSGDATDVVYPAMPVIVKTPACPVVVAPPPRDSEGAWQLDEVDDGIRARFVAPDGKLLGFALAGAEIRQRQALSAELPPLLD